MFNPSLRIRSLLASFATVTCLSAQGLKAHALETVDKDAFTIAFSGDMLGTGYQDGKMVSYDGEILQRIADALKLKVKPALMEWSGTIASVQSKRVDVMPCTTGWTEPPPKMIALSDLIHYFKNGITQADKTD